MRDGGLEFKSLAEKLDSMAPKLPRFKDILKIPHNSSEDIKDSLFPFVEKLEKILKYLGVKEVRISAWNLYCLRVDFKPLGSSYFRIGPIGKREGVSLRKDLEATIAVGFDEDLEYGPDEKDHKTEIIIWYQGDEFDIHLFKPEKWKEALGEFFDITGLK